MAKLELTLHPVKTKIVNLWGGKEGFDFLGIHHRCKPITRDGKRIYHAIYQWPSEKARQSMYEKINGVVGVRKSIGCGIKELIQTLNRKIDGWRNYYGLKGSYSVLNKVDDHIIERFTIWWNNKKQRRPRHGQMTMVRRITKANGLKRVACYN
jgi:RNA-directed DNA polymerase